MATFSMEHLHYTLHLLAVVTAITLFVISVVSYKKHKRKRFLYICLAFFLFAVKEVITGIEVVFFQNYNLVALSHVIDFAVIILFFIGVVK